MLPQVRVVLEPDDFRALGPAFTHALGGSGPARAGS